LPEVAEQLWVKLYPQIRDSSEFKNASANGLPLAKYRLAHPACQDFKALAKDMVIFFYFGAIAPAPNSISLLWLESFAFRIWTRFNLVAQI